MKNEPRAKDLMRHPVRQLTPWVTVPEAAAFLLRAGISGALVADDHGRPIGVFSQKELATHLQSRLNPAHPPAAPKCRAWEETTVSDLMTPGVVTVDPEAPLGEVARIMAKWKFHRVFVEKDGTIVGVITGLDVLAWVGRTVGTPKAVRKAVHA